MRKGNTMPKIKKLEMNCDELDDFNTILICAERYAIGRASYMPQLVVDFIKRNKHLLTVRTARIIAMEIAELDDFGISLGMERDKKMWREFRKWLLDFTKEKDDTEQQNDTNDNKR